MRPGPGGPGAVEPSGAVASVRTSAADDDDAERGRDLAAAERPDAAAAASGAGSEAGCSSARGGRRQIDVLNGTYRARSASQSMSIATPISATSRPPTSETTRPWRTSGRISAGARS